MHPDCRCDDALGSLTYVGEPEPSEALDELLEDAPAAPLGELSRVDDTRLEWLDDELAGLATVGAEDIDLDDDEIGWLSDALKLGKGALDLVTGPSKSKAKSARQAATKQKQRADRLQKQVDQAAKADRLEQQRAAAMQARQTEQQHKREKAELEQRIMDLRNEQAMVRTRINREKAQQKEDKEKTQKRMLLAGGGLLALGTTAYAIRAAMKAREGQMKGSGR